jgi:predicted HAD superfamily Cof-like phosphohydrolase
MFGLDEECDDPECGCHAAVIPQTIREQVLEFHEAMGVPVAPVPTVPEAERIHLRLRLVAEEFFELCGACGIWCGDYRAKLTHQIAGVEPDMVNIVELADACADLDYVVEGTRLEFGIDGGPIAAEVQRSNMAKLGGAMREDGKILKPDGWTPPDIAGELRKQGWKG